MTFVSRMSEKCPGISLRKAILIFSASLVLLLSSSSVFAQLNLGRILGTVYDQTGAVVPGATVTVLDVDRGVSHPLISDGAGQFSASSLTPGTYTVSAEAKGFKKIDRENVVVGVGQDVRVDLTLQPGEQTQTVTVTGSLPLMQTTNAQLGQTIEDQQFNDLPIAGRQYVKLLSYQPGVLGAANGFGVTISIHGIRGDENGFLFDGIDDINVLVSTSGSIVGGSQVQEQSTILPQDSIQQVDLVANAKAEYGWRPGAQISVGMKSGTNNIHGTAYAFGRDTALDARNAFLKPPLTIANDQLEQFGVSVGGPIKKDKLFYFGNYEGQRFVVGGPRNLTLPTTADLGAGVTGAGGSFPDAIAGVYGAGMVPSTLSLNLAGCNATQVATIAAAHPGNTLTGALLAPACNAANGLFANASASNTVPYAQNNVGGSNNGIEKIDWHLNDHNSINGEDFFGDGNQAQVGNSVQPYWRGGAHGRAQLVRVVWVWTPNSTWVNEARFGYDRLHNPLFPLEGEPGNGNPNYMTQFGFDTGLPMPGSPLSDAVAPGCPQCGFPILAISGGGGPAFTSLGAATGQKALQGTYHGVDSISWTRGNHLFKFGGEYATTGFTGIGLETNGTGSITFGGSPAFTGATALQDFLVGAPYTGQLLVGNPIAHIRYNRAAGFIQDDWRVSNKITVNLGLRYEYVAPLSEANNHIGNFSASSPTGMVQTGQPGAPSSLYHFSHDMLGPRGGIVWDPFGKGTTVVRLGGSVLYNSAISLLTLLVQNAALTQIPTGFNLFNPAGANVNTTPGTINVGNLAITATVPWAVNTPIFPSPSSQPACGNGLKQVAPGNTTLTNPAPCTPFGINPDFPNAYVATWTLAIQHALTNNLSFTVGYVGNRGIHIGAPIDLDQPLPGPKTGIVNGTATTVASSFEQTQRPFYSQFPYFSRIQYFTGDEESSYNALELSLVERATKGLTFNASYTQSHGLDVSGTERGFTIMNSRNPLQDWGNSANDPFTHFSLTATYNVPGRKAPGQMLEGWQVNTALQLVGGVPFNADDTTDDFSGTGENLDRWTLSGPASAFNGVLGGTGTVPCYSISTGSFAKTANCTTVSTPTGAPGTPGTLTAVASMPAACIAAAQHEAVNTTMNAASAGSSSGLLSLATVGCYYVNGVAMVPPAQGTYGTMNRDAFRAKGFREWDASVTKSWKFNERLSTQFRAEFYNLLNRTIYAGPSANLAAPLTFGQVQNTPNSTDPVIGQGGPREIQLGLKFIF